MNYSHKAFTIGKDISDLRTRLIFFLKLFETCFMVANDDLEGKTTHFTGFYTHTISGPNIPKPPIVI